MGVYINCMAMPKNCDECPFVFFDGQVDEHSWCEAIKPYGINLDKCYETGRHKDCPLIELPPHGLIDKQMLLRNISENQFTNSYVGHEDEYAFWNKVWDYILDAPTIIEAEEADDGNTD